MNNTVFLPQLAFVFSSLCLGGILCLMVLVSLARRNSGGVDASDGCLATFLSLLLAIAALTALALVVFA